MICIKQLLKIDVIIWGAVRPIEVWFLSAETVEETVSTITVTKLR